MLPPLLAGVALWLVLINAITASLYYWDKRMAKRGGWRISEANLLTASALGGWPAAIYTGRTLRHKTAKGSYRWKFAGAIVINLVIVGLLSRWAAGI